MQTVMLGLALAANPTNPNPAWDDGWAERESWALTDHVQLSDEAEFLRAGESYFSPDGHMVIFQGTPRPGPGETAERHYGMYVAPVIRRGGRIVGLGRTNLLTNPGSSNTCGWFHPTDYHTGEEYLILYGTTTTAPDEEAASGYQRGTSRYTWQFPNEMEVVRQRIRAGDSERPWIGDEPEFIWQRDGYDAEGSWSPDGRHILYTRLEPGSDEGDLWILDTKTGVHTELVAEPGYDGGPFFSPCGTRICYRSDRRGDKALQLFIAELAFDADGAVTGIEREIPITDNEHVNWAPFFTPCGTMLFYASSEVSHSNYEVFATEATGDHPPRERPRVRITDARGFDGLPVFSPDGQWMMWTAQRGALVAGETRPSSQLWAARIDLDAVRARLAAERRRIADELLEENFDEYMPGG